MRAAFEDDPAVGGGQGGAHHLAFRQREGVPLHVGPHRFDQARDIPGAEAVHGRGAVLETLVVGRAGGLLVVRDDGLIHPVAVVQPLRRLQRRRTIHCAFRVVIGVDRAAAVLVDELVPGRAGADGVHAPFLLGGIGQFEHGILEVLPVPVIRRHGDAGGLEAVFVIGQREDAHIHGEGELPLFGVVEERPLQLLEVLDLLRLVVAVDVGIERQDQPLARPVGQGGAALADDVRRIAADHLGGHLVYEVGGALILRRDGNFRVLLLEDLQSLCRRLGEGVLGVAPCTPAQRYLPFAGGGGSRAGRRRGDGAAHRGIDDTDRACGRRSRDRCLRR